MYLCFLGIPGRIHMLKGSIPVLAYSRSRQDPMGRVRRADSRCNAASPSLPSDLQSHVFLIDIRSCIHWFSHLLLIDFSCPACYGITRNPKNDPTVEYSEDTH